MSSNPLRQKIVFVGDVSTGKSSIIERFIHNKFKEVYDPSIGVDFNTKTINFNNKTLKVQIWDSAGQEKYKSLIPSYVRNSVIIYLVFDVTNKESFNNLSKWIKFIKSITKCLIVILGNKIDLDNNRVISFEEAYKFCSDEELLFFEISAKTSYNINTMFYTGILHLPLFDLTRKEINEKMVESIRKCCYF